MTERASLELLPLYGRLHFDEDVSASVVRNLQQRGFDVLSTHEAHSLRLDDDAQLAVAISEQPFLITHNRSDFEALHKRHLAEGQTHYGIIIAKRRASDAAVVVNLLALLNSATADELINQIRYI